MHRNSRALVITFILSAFSVFSGACGDDDTSDVGCCAALPGQDQLVCDSLEALGEDRCNMINSGATCAWSAAPECASAGTDAGSSDTGSETDAADTDGGSTADGGPAEDGGPATDGGPGSDVPSVDAGATGCCVARGDTDQMICDEVEPFGLERCNAVNDGESCGWSDEPACAPEPIDACCVAQPGMSQDLCDEVEPSGEARCNRVGGGEACSWSDAIECSLAPVGCCVARNSADQAMCDELEEAGEARCTALNGGRTCGWSDAPECSPVVEPTCCQPISPRFADTCAELEGDTEGCASSRVCNWNRSCEPVAPVVCCVGAIPGNDEGCATLADSMVRCDATRRCVWNDDPSCR